MCNNLDYLIPLGLRVRSSPKPVARRLPVCSSLLDSSGTATAEEARTRQRADVQLPTDIQLSNSVEENRAAGAEQSFGHTCFPRRTFHDCSQRSAAAIPPRLRCSMS